MFRLIKLAAYLLLGYTLYELVLGVLEGSGGVHPQAPSQAPPAARPQRQSRGRASAGAGGNNNSATPANLTGSSSTMVDGSDGSHRRTNVGRGVVSR